MSTEQTKVAPEQQELNIWSALDLLCQAVEAAQTKGAYNLKDAALLSRCVDLARNTLEKVAQAETQPAAQPEAEAETQPMETTPGYHKG